MSKKLLISLIAPVLATAAFAVIPAASQAAEPHYYLNGTGASSELKPGKKQPTVTWGTLTLKSAIGTTTCHNIDSGYSENPTTPKGAAGIDVGEDFQPFFECKAPGCPGEIKVFGRADGNGIPAILGGTGKLLGTFPLSINGGKAVWKSHLVRSTNPETGEANIRDVTEGIEIEIICEAPPGTVVLAAMFSGTNQPETVNGQSAGKPSYGEFAAGSGELISPEFGPGTTSGRDKVMGYEEQEVVDTN